MTEAAIKTAWSPVTHPFRVVVTRGSTQRGCNGWASHVKGTFPTLEEAKNEAERPQGRGVLNVTVDEAINPETWTRNGRWQQRFKRGPKA